MYAYVLRNSCCTCFFDCTFLWLFVIFFSWYNKKDTMTKKKNFLQFRFVNSHDFIFLPELCTESTI